MLLENKRYKRCSQLHSHKENVIDILFEEDAFRGECRNNNSLYYCK